MSENFFFCLTGQEALCGWTVAQEKQVERDIFVAKMRFEVIQRELCNQSGNTPEETVQSALLHAKAAQMATSSQKQLRSSTVEGSASHQGSNSAQNFRIRQEPTYSVQIEKLSVKFNRAQQNSSQPREGINTKDVTHANFEGIKSQQIINKVVQLRLYHIEIAEKRSFCELLQFQNHR